MYVKHAVALATTFSAESFNMADGECESVSGNSKCDKDENYDARLDFFSEKFDPLLALRTPGLKVPDNSAKKYDNVAIYHSATDKETQVLKQIALTKQQSKKTESEKVERRWLPHQLPVKSEVVFNRRNVLTRMEEMKGPLALLRKCKDERLKLKIWTRHEKGVRGYCLGYVIAFDKHWNLALEEVTEFWTRPKKKKIPALDSLEKGAKPKIRIKPPKVTITPHETNKKLENCTRNVDQLIMRGEHIVLISAISEPS